MDIVLSVLPVIASVGATVVTALGFIKKVKNIIGDKEKQNEALRKSNAKLTEKIEETNSKMEDLVSQSEEKIKLQAEEIALLKKQVEEKTKETIEIKNLIDNATIIRNQLTTLLNKEK